MRTGRQRIHRQVSTAMTRPRRRILSGLLLVLCLLALVAGQVRASESQTVTEDLIRSAMLYNFCKFIEWPINNDPIVLGVLSDAESLPDFSSIIGKTVHGSVIDVRRLESLEDMAGCDLVFIDKDQEEVLKQALNYSRSRAILTISEMDDFCTQGGIIQLVERRGKLRFFVNRKAADQASLSLSSQLLKMAKIVEGD